MHTHAIRWTIAFMLAGFSGLGGCASSPPPPQNPPAAEPKAGAPGRTAIPQAECETQGGTVVGDIGDGATQRPDYVCPSGKPPLGNIEPPAGGPMPIEGAVCCPR